MADAAADAADTASPHPASSREFALVWTTSQGAPQRLIWAGRRFVVVAKPIAWVDRLSWWELSPRAPRGQSLALLEQPMWQVQVQDVDHSELLIFDLVASTGRQWPVTGIYD